MRGARQVRPFIVQKLSFLVVVTMAAPRALAFGPMRPSTAALCFECRLRFISVGALLFPAPENLQY